MSNYQATRPVKLIRFAAFSKGSGVNATLIDEVSLTAAELAGDNLHVLIQCQSGTLNLRWDGTASTTNPYKLSGTNLDTIELWGKSVRNCQLSGDGGTATGVVIISEITGSSAAP